MRSGITRLIGLAAGAAVLVMASSVARATVTLSVTASDASDTITDNMSGDIDPTTGQIIFDQAIGGFSTNINAGVSANGSLELQTIDVHNNSGQQETISVTLTDTSKDVAGSPRMLSSTGNGTFSSAPTGDSVTFVSTANGTSTPAQTVESPGFSPNSPLSPFALSAQTVSFPDSGTFQLQEKVTIVASPGSTVNFDGIGQVTVVPEPVSFGALAALSGAALLRRRRA